LADPPAVTDSVAQPLHPLGVHLAIAALPPGRAHGPEHAVALLPLPQRVGCDARSPGECCDVEQGCGHWTIPGRIVDQNPSPYALRMPEGDSLHRAAARLRTLFGLRLTAPSPHPRGLVTGVAKAIDGRRLEGVEAVGKNLLLRFEGGVTVRSHLRMNGRWRVGPSGSDRGGGPVGRPRAAR